MEQVVSISEMKWSVLVGCVDCVLIGLVRPGWVVSVPTVLPSGSRAPQGTLSPFYCLRPLPLPNGGNYQLVSTINKHNPIHQFTLIQLHGTNQSM
jgi:hypothetical protein